MTQTQDALEEMPVVKFNKDQGEKEVRGDAVAHWYMEHEKTIRAALKASLSAPQAAGVDMKGFIEKIFSTYWENSCCDIYGEDIQTWGENFGILRAETYDPDAHGEYHMMEWDAVPNESTIYVYSPEFKGAAPVPRLSEQDAPTGKWLRQDNLLYTLKRAGFKKGEEVFQNETIVNVAGDHADEVAGHLHKILNEDAPTVEAVTELPDGWDLYCLGRASQGEYWLEVREIKSGKLARDLGMSLVYSDTIEGAFKSATKMIEAALQNAASQGGEND